MERATRALVSTAVWIAWSVMVVTWTPVVLVVFLLTAWWDRRRRIVGRVFRISARWAVALNPLWSVRFHGRLPGDRDQPYVVVCNHQSLADVVLVGSLPWESKWISKKAIFRLPFLGQMMWMAGDVSVRRDDRESRSQAYDELRKWLERGASVMIFPEGTRSRTGEMLPFRNGAFRLAIEAGVPVLPLAVAGTRDAIRKGSLLFGRARAEVAILEPEPSTGWEMDDVAAFRERVKDRIREARDGLRGERSPAEA